MTPGSAELKNGELGATPAMEIGMIVPNNWFVAIK